MKPELSEAQLHSLYGLLGEPRQVEQLTFLLSEITPALLDDIQHSSLYAVAKLVESTTVVDGLTPKEWELRAMVEELLQTVTCPTFTELELRAELIEGLEKIIRFLVPFSLQCFTRIHQTDPTQD